MMTPIQPAAYRGMPTVVPGNKPVTFGRDAVFERNERYEELTDDDPKLLKKLYQLLKSLSGSHSRNSADEVDRESAFLYDDQGRVRGAYTLMPAIDAAQAEFQLRQVYSTGDPFEHGVVGVKVANAMLAADMDNENAHQLLDRSLQQIERSGWDAKTDPIPQGIVHGYYNRGAYWMNNVIYQESKQMTGAFQSQLSEVGHEGLALMIQSKQLRNLSLQNLKKGIQDLETATSLALRADPKRKIGAVEYQIAQGEAYHFLSHLSLPDMKAVHRYDRKAMEAFEGALKTAISVQAHAGPRHIELVQKLIEVKIPHLASQQHQQLSTRKQGRITAPGEQYVKDREAEGITGPPQTRFEEIDAMMKDLRA